MRIITGLFLIVVVFIGTSFALLNAQRASINLYMKTYSLPLSLLLVIVLGVGVLLGFFTMYARCLRLKRENRQVTKKMLSFEEEVKNLRSLPLTEPR